MSARRVLFAVVAGLTLAACGGRGGEAPVRGAGVPVDHVVVLFLENRSFAFDFQQPPRPPIRLL